MKSLTARAHIKKSVIKKKAVSIFIDVLKQNTCKYEIEEAMLTYYKYATYVKSKMISMNRKLKKFKVP